MIQEESLTISDSGVVAENITVQADQVAGRDFYKVELKEVKEDARLLFSTIDVSPYSQENYIAPNFTNELLEKTLNNGILILSGGQGFDKGSFIRHLAHLLISKTEGYDLKEIQSNNDNQSLFRYLLQGGEKLIYLLDQLHPQHFDYDLEKFHRLATQKKSFLLVTTDLAIDSWDLQENTRVQYSFVIPASGLYNPIDLESHLQQELHEKKHALKDLIPVKFENFLSDQLYGKSLNQIAGEFATPEKISFFVSILSRESREITIERFEEIFKEINNSNQSLVTKWFRTLDHKQKLVALGISLLEGMYDDQFFAVMQEVVEGFWKYSNPALQALDYIDLEFLWDYFKLDATKDSKQIIKNRFPHERTDIIKAAWTTHRRHILAILPVLVRIVNNSVKEKTTNWEKYGTRQRQRNIRLAISNSIGDVGLVSVPSVENALIELASQENTTLQRVAAKALARWREFGQDEQLFNTIKNWLEDERIQNLLNDFLAKRDLDNPIKIGAKASSYLKATSVLALSYSANYDSPNHLNIRIIELIKEIADSSDNLVRRRIQEALPRIIHHHVLQLKDVLVEDLIKFDDLAAHIGDGLANAYYDYPHDLKSTLFQWLEICSQNSSNNNQRKKFTYRDKVLITVFETFQRIKFSNTEEDVISINEVFDWLLKFAEQEGRSTVRENLFLTLGKILSIDWVKAERYLPGFFPSSDLSETKIIVEKFVEIYLIQRQALDGGSDGFFWNEDYYPVWFEYNERPFTEIEKIMLSWMDKGDLILKQISTLSFLNFAQVFEENEIDQIEILKEKLRKQSFIKRESTFNTDQAAPKTPSTSVEPILSLWIRIYIFFLLLFEKKDDKITLKALFKLLLKYPNFSHRQLNLVFLKWKRSQNTTTQKIASWLSRLIH